MHKLESELIFRSTGIEDCRNNKCELRMFKYLTCDLYVHSLRREYCYDETAHLFHLT